MLFFHRTCRTRDAGRRAELRQLRADFAETCAHRVELGQRLVAAQQRADTAEAELARILDALGTEVENTIEASA